MLTTANPTPAECPMVYTDEASAMTRKHPRTLARLAARGKFLKPIRIGRQLAWPRPALLAYLGLTPAPTT